MTPGKPLFIVDSAAYGIVPRLTVIANNQREVHSTIALTIRTADIRIVQTPPLLCPSCWKSASRRPLVLSRWDEKSGELLAIMIAAPSITFGSQHAPSTKMLTKSAIEAGRNADEHGTLLAVSKLATRF